MFHKTSQTDGQTRQQLFVYNCGAYHSNGHLVIHNKLLIDIKVKEWNCVIMFLLTYHDNVSTGFL